MWGMEGAQHLHYSSFPVVVTFPSTVLFTLLHHSRYSISLLLEICPCQWISDRFKQRESSWSVVTTEARSWEKLAPKIFFQKSLFSECCAEQNKKVYFNLDQNAFFKMQASIFAAYNKQNRDARMKAVIWIYNTCF